MRIGRAVDRSPSSWGSVACTRSRNGCPCPLIFLGVVVVMAVIAERVGRLFSAFAPLDAYRLDVLGSIGGIVAFSTLSFADAGPLVWIVIAVGVLIFLLRDELTRVVVVGLAALLVLGVVSWLQPHDIWSPYQHVTYASVTTAGGDPREQPATSDHGTAVDPARRATLLRVPVPSSARRSRRRPDRGGGSGNDVALALPKGRRTSTRSRSTPCCSGWGATCTRSIRTRTRG